MLKLTIGHKLALSCALTACFAAGAAYNQWDSNTDIRAATEAVAREQTILGGISRAQLALSRLEGGYRAIDLARSGQDVEKAVAAVAREAAAGAEGLDRPIAIALKPEVLVDSQRALRELASVIADYARVGRADLSGREADAGAVRAARDRITGLIARADAAASASVGNANRFTEEASRSALARVASATGIGLLAGAAVLLSLLASAVLLMVNIRRPILSLVRLLERMAGGEIEARIPEAGRADEIGALGRAVEGIRALVARKAAEEAERKEIAEAAAAAERRRTVIELADGFERAVGGIVGQVSASAVELQATAQQMTANATDAASRSSAVAASAGEAADNVGTVAAAAEELGSSVHEIGRQVQGSAELARTAVGEADQTSRLVQDLSRTSARIGDMIGLISNIAGQTNLLALNATIEAARAGEAGRGFAVVAAEVKELANQTARAAEEIARQIGAVQGVTEQAVTAIDTITGRIGEIDAVATMIAAAVEEQGAATREIVRNVAQASAGTSVVTDTIVGVARASEETGTAAGHVLSAASELSRQSEQLGHEVARFLTHVRAV